MRIPPGITPRVRTALFSGLVAGISLSFCYGAGWEPRLGLGLAPFLSYDRTVIINNTVYRALQLSCAVMAVTHVGECWSVAAMM